MLAAEPAPFGRYLLDSKLASGGMGEVFLARVKGPVGFEKKVVIKRILPHLAQSSEFVTRFLDEGRIVVQLTHGNIVQVFDMGQVDGHYFLAMEYVDGIELRGLLRRLKHDEERMPVELATYIISEAAKGLAYAHTRCDDTGRKMGIIHRDVSPSNVMISRGGEVKLLDFGIAKAAGQLAESISGSLHGKFLYMSPEQASGATLDHRSDLFSLGTCLYEMLSGERPFSGKSELDTLALIREGTYTPLSDLREDIPSPVIDIVSKCLEVSRDDRYENAEELHRAILDYLLDAKTIISNADLSQFAVPYLDARTPSQKLSIDAALAQQLDAALISSEADVEEGTQVAGPVASDALADPISHVGSDSGVIRKDSGTTTRSHLHMVESEVPRSSRNRILIASVVLLVGVLVTLNLVTLGELRKRSSDEGVDSSATTQVVAVGQETQTNEPPQSKKTTMKPVAAVGEEAAKGTPAPPASVVATQEEPGANKAPKVPSESDPIANATASPPSSDLAQEPSRLKKPVPSELKSDGSELDSKLANPAQKQPMYIRLVSALPDARVAINGKSVKPGPKGTFRVPEGEGEVRVEVSAAGRRTYSETLGRQFNKTVDVTPKHNSVKRWVQVRATPKNAAIWIGGRNVGTGSHRVSVSEDRPVRGRIVLQGYETRGFVATHSGRKVIAIKLKSKETGVVELRVMPANAVVKIDGKVVKAASKQINRVTVRLAPGEHRLVAKTADGTYSKVRRFTIRSGRSTKLGQINLVSEKEKSNE